MGEIRQSSSEVGQLLYRLSQLSPIVASALKGAHLSAEVVQPALEEAVRLALEEERLLLQKTRSATHEFFQPIAFIPGQDDRQTAEQKGQFLHNNGERSSTLKW